MQNEPKLLTWATGGRTWGVQTHKNRGCTVQARRPHHSGRGASRTVDHRTEFRYNPGGNMKLEYGYGA